MSESHITQSLYFQRPGPKNTEATLAHAAQRAEALGIKKVVIASVTGSTVKAALDHFDPKTCQIIMVSQVAGFMEPDVQKLDEATRAELEAKGVKVLTAAHAFGGVGRGVRTKLNTFQVDEIMAFTLRLLGQGVKVGVEITLMAADRGWVRSDEEIITIAGTGKGADTALVIKPASSANCMDLKVKEIITKPYNP